MGNNNNSKNNRVTIIPNNRVKVVKNKNNNSKINKDNKYNNKNNVSDKKSSPLKTMGRAVNVAGHIVHGLKAISKITKTISKKGNR